jgi:DNA-binding PadR family transcriptional regulator
MLKFVLLGLLGDRPRHGYDLKSVFEQLLGGTWPLNIAQIYAALTGLEREGLVECEIVPQEQVPDRKVYSLTEKGAKELDEWIDRPVVGPVRLRDEFVLKILVRTLVGGGDATALIWQQRRVAMRQMAELTRLRSQPDLHRATALLVEAAVLRLEADLKWLDVCEEHQRGEAEA